MENQNVALFSINKKYEIWLLNKQSKREELGKQFERICHKLSKTRERTEAVSPRTYIGIDPKHKTGAVGIVQGDWAEVHDLPTLLEGGVNTLELKHILEKGTANWPRFGRS